MCNLYSITRSQDAMRRLFRVGRDLTGNLPLLPGVFPDTMAPVVRVASDGERELSLMRWGFPPPPNLGRVPVTNVRNMASPYWRGWLKAQWRCLVPATSFCEWTDSRPKVTNWFALDESRPLFAFAGSPALPVFAFVPFVEKFIGHPFSSWPSSHRNPREALHRIQKRASR